MIQKISLSNFRNFKRKLFSFSPKTTIIVGPNTTGKTNILEGLFLLSTGKSFRAGLVEEMINHRAEIARVKGKLGDKQILEVVLTRGEVTLGKEMQRAPKRRVLVNGVAKRLSDFAGNFKTVLFGPWDLDLVTESPSIRREFLDTVLFQVDHEYYRALISYEKGLRQRNKLLYRIREENLSRSQLLFWDRLLIKNGNYLSLARENLINFINQTGSVDSQKFSLEYDRSAISESRLSQYAQEEVAAATTLVGPHRDDFVFFLKNRDLAKFGSRGEQRMGVLWLKMAELAFVEEKSGEKPTLLLDDIFSELDQEHRKQVMEVAKGHQTIITTASEHFTRGLKGIEKIELQR